MLRKCLKKFSSTKLEMKEPMRVAVTGAAGQIGYSLLFRIASGEMLGRDQPVILHLIDLPQAVDALQGVKMELNDCAFPLLAGLVCTDSQSVGFKDVDVALLVGAKPRSADIERKDLLAQNGKIFSVTGKAIGENASRTCKTLVVGNPANTNCFIAMQHAIKQGLQKHQFNAMTRLDHDRGLHQIAHKLNKNINDINQFVIWGNHSATMFPDITYATIGNNKVTDLVDLNWYNKDMLPTVQQRGTAIIKARKLSSAASAANAAIAHVRDWTLGTNGRWVSMSIPSDGSYAIDNDLIFSYPCTVDTNGNVSIVQGLSIDTFQRSKIQATMDELNDERSQVIHLI